MGLKQQIREAVSVSELARLVMVGKTFQYASKKTQNRWATAYKSRLQELTVTKKGK